MAEQRYKVIERIDAGGMAEVFKANSTSMQGFQKLVAIKRILPNLTQNERFVRMFLDEAKVSLHLNHTNCVHVFDLGIADGTYFIVMEFVDGTNLKKLIKFFGKHNQSIRVEHAVFIAIEVCKGLTHAHEKKDQQGNPLDIVHRDISPPNVLLSNAGEVKITDFGLAKAKSQAESTDPGVVKGKFGYLSPEAAHGEEIDERTDIFAVGILLWEMLAGRRLFLGESDYDTLQQVRNANIPSISDIRSDVPPYLEGILKRTLAKNVEDRYQTAQQLGEALAEFLFDYGQTVTNYDIAGLIEQYRDQKPQRTATKIDQKVAEAAQKQLDQLKSLEEIEDLDMYLAEHYDSLPDQGEMREDSGEGNFEDPRMWADLGGFDSGAPPDGGSDATPAPGGSNPGSTPGAQSPDSWEETGLDDVARATSSFDAVGQGDAPSGVEAAEAAATAAAQARQAPQPDHNPQPQRSPQPQQQQPQQSPPTMPGDMPAPSSEPDASPRAAPAAQPSRSETPVTDSDEASGIGPTAITLIVALIVVALGVGAGFALGYLPPS